MTGKVTIYVLLPDEAVDVWRPVVAEPLGENYFEIDDQPYDRGSERWQFEPGAHVVCEGRDLEGEAVLVAVASAE